MKKQEFRSVALVALAACALALSLTQPAAATSMLEVTYTDGTIDFGPLSFGLNALPGSVDATFVLGAGEGGIEPGEVNFDTADVLSAFIAFGDATWTESELISFSLQMIGDTVNALTYEFAPITTLTAANNPILNFPLTIAGTDIASGQAFQYTYASSTQTLTVPNPPALVLLLLGLAGVMYGRGRRSRRG